jgi:hypothetical protein
VSLSPLGAPLSASILLQYGAFRVKTLSCNGHATTTPLASYPSWRCYIWSLGLGQAVVAVGCWCCLRTTANEVCLVRVGRKVQRARVYWRT